MLETAELSTMMSVFAKFSLLGWRKESVLSPLTMIMSLFYNKTLLEIASYFNNRMI